MLIQQGPQGVYISGTLMNQSLTATKHRCAGLLLNCLGLHEAHLRLPSSDRDRLGVSSVIFLALDERASVLWRDQLHLVTKRFHLARPEVRATTGFKDHQAEVLLGHKHGGLLSRELFAELHFSGPQRAVNLENILCQINPNHHILHLAVLSVAWL